MLIGEVILSAAKQNRTADLILTKDVAIYVAEYESDMLSKKAELEAEGLDVSVKTWEYENPCND